MLCDILCYVCPDEDNTFEYLITSQNIPTQLKNCSIVTGEHYCCTIIRWQQNQNKSSIKLTFLDFDKLRTTFEINTVEAEAYVFGDSTQSGGTHSVTYTCDTAKCNQPAILKPLVESLTWTNKLDEFKYLLESNGTFDGRWCSFLNNTTDVQNNVIPLADCKQCAAEMVHASGSKKVDFSCFKDVDGTNRLSHEAIFRLKNRIHIEKWRIRCQRPDCGSLSIMDQIYEKNKINFDMNKFLTRTSSSLRIVFSLYLMFLTLLFTKGLCHF